MSVSTNQLGITYALSFFLISFNGTLNFAAPPVLRPGVCIHHTSSGNGSRFAIDNYRFNSFATGLHINYTSQDDLTLETDVCRVLPGRVELEIGEGSLIAPDLMNVCEAARDTLLVTVRSIIPRSGCTYDEGRTRLISCLHAQDSRNLRSPTPSRSSAGSTAEGNIGPESTSPPEDIGLEPTSSLEAFGPNDRTGLPCETGLGSSYSGGGNFCTGACGDLVAQTLMRMQPGVPRILPDSTQPIAIWQYSEVWENCP